MAPVVAQPPLRINSTLLLHPGYGGAQSLHQAAGIIIVSVESALNKQFRVRALQGIQFDESLPTKRPVIIVAGRYCLAALDLRPRPMVNQAG